MTNSELKALSFRLRRTVLEMIHTAKGGHFGGDFSVMDILVSLYFKHMNISPDYPDDPNRDRFLLSKGHTAEALYAVLAHRGFFPAEELKTFSQFGARLIGHPNHKVPGVEMNSGSLGHGLSVGVGMALAGKLDEAPYRVYVVMGDGELAEGSVWEGAMAAGHFKLGNLIAFVDRNQLQISGPTETVMRQECLEMRWQSFGWNVIHACGHDYSSLDAAISGAKDCADKPTVIIADTVKGYGYSEAENQAGWHHKVPTEEQYQKAMKELSEREAAV